MNSHFPLWKEKCVAHYGDDVQIFFDTYFSNYEKKCLLIGGAGFDPRSAKVSHCLSDILKEKLSVIALKEERPQPKSDLVEAAEINLKAIDEKCNNLKVENLDIFADDGAVIGGQNIINRVKILNIEEFSDLIIDMSALSSGISFPLVSYLFNYIKEKNLNTNIHLVVVSNPEIDIHINSEPNDRVSNIRGFDLPRLYGENEKARLWLPIISESRVGILKTIYDDLSPQDICPILPFPSDYAKKGDKIACDVFSMIETEWGSPLNNDWGLDPRNFLYADEHRPLDIYRTIIRIDDERKPVFETFGGSTTVLSPSGSKIPSIGALMAALERNFPVKYVEALSYTVNWDAIIQLDDTKSRMTHIWLYGDAYL